MPAFPIGIGGRLIAEHDGTKATVLSASIPKPRWNLAVARTAVQKTNSAVPMKIPATVNAPIRQTLGVGDGRTLSVVKDMPRRSPVSMIMTISMGVRMACPVMTRPTARKSTCTIFFSNRV